MIKDKYMKKLLLKNKKKRIKELSDELDNVIFLDYDGVINLDTNNYGESKFDSTCISNLNKLCLKYNLKIVVISSWRKYSNYKELLYNSGFNKNINILGKTNVLESSREEEIIDYLSSHPYINKFIILDDGNYIKLESYQVKTIFTEGFNSLKYKEAENLINSNIWDI